VRITSQSATRPPYFLGVDVGGTGIKIGLVDDDGTTLAYETLPTRESEGPTAAMRRVAAVLNQFISQLSIAPTDVAAIGIGAPGPMDLATGLLVQPPQLPNWWDFNLRDCLAELTRRPVSLNNDANAAAFGEYWLGSGKSASSMVLLTLGTGVGGGIISDGRLLNGANSFGGEFGHLMIDPSPEARLCAWGGGRGQFEAYASASAVAIRTRQRLDEGVGGLLSLVDGEVTPLDVFHAAEQNDALALEIIDEAARWLGIGITTIVHVLDPGMVVIGGAMTFGGDQSSVGRRFLDRIRQEFRQHTFDNVFAGTSIDFAQLGADAGYLGAAGYARSQSNL
jgi:glucokinase